jgi:uncharacterized cupin superfamily protein
MGKIDLQNAPKASGTRYPEEFAGPCKGREWLRAGDAAGLTQFGVNIMTVPPGTWTSQRHWHSHEDEFVWVLEGELMLHTDKGKEALRAGECAGFKAGEQDGHCLKNESNQPAKILVVGSRNDLDHGEYSDIDMKFGAERYSAKGNYTRKDGTPF